MRKLSLILPFLLASCPGGAPPDKGQKPEVETRTDKPEPDKPEPDEPELAVPIFAFGAGTATYTKGKDGAPDTLELSRVDDNVHSLDGKTTAELMKVLESNLFPEKVVVLPPQLKGAEAPEGGKTRAWLVWLDEEQAEVTLANPLYSAGAGTLKFDVEVIDGPVHEGPLGKVELKLQDCPDQDYQCAKFTLESCQATTGKVGTCWNWLALNCLPCHCSEDMAICKEKDPKCCGNADAPCYPSRLGPHGWERYCL